MPITPIRSYPLEWPLGWTATVKRKRSAFADRSEYGATQILLEELDRLKVSSLVISCNIEYSQTGAPYSRQRPMTNPGVAIFFQFKKGTHVLACDKWDKLADNIYAIAKHIEALRGQERWGVGNIEQSFAGYKALPQVASRRAWWNVLNVSPDAPREQIKAAWKSKSFSTHPDHGGSTHLFQEVQDAYEEAQKIFI